MFSARSAYSRALLLLFVLAVPISAAASTAQFQVFLDTDNNAATGCTAIAGGTSIPGVEHVLSTTVETTAAGSNVTGVTRQECSGSLLGAAIVVNATGWPVGTSGSSGNSEIETHLPLSALGGALPAVQRLYFAGTTGSLSSVLTTQPNGNPILFPQPQGRRRAANPGSSTGRRVITLDGEVGDWNGVQPILAGGASATGSPITFRSIFAVAGDADLFFRLSVKLDNAPVAVDDNYDGAQGGATNIFPPGVLSNDSSPGGEALTAILVSGPQHGTVTLNSDGGFAYLNDGSNSPVDSFTYKASNGTLESNTATVTINIVLNTPPVANNDSYSVPHGGTLTVIPPGVLGNDTDADGDALTAILVSGPQHGTLTLNPDGSFTYTHDGSNSTNDGFNYRAFDGIASTQAHVTITIGPDAPPVAVADGYTVAEGGTLSVPAPGLFANDSDPDSPQALWSAALGTGPLHGALTLNANGSFVYVHDGSETTTDSFTYTLSDGILTSAPATVTITITPVNDAPVATADNYSTNEDTTLNVLAPGVLGNDTDPDSAMTAVLVSTTTNGNLTLNPNGSFTYIPNPDFNGTDSFTYRANDGLANSNTVTVTITVNAVNDAPVVTNATFSLNENSANGTAVGTVTFTDPDGGQTHTFAITAGNTGGAFAINPSTGAITVASSAALDFETTPSFSLTVTVTDNGSPVLSGTGTITINLNDVNEAPVVNAATFSIPENSANGTAVGTVTFTDPDGGQTHTFAITAGNTGGAFAIDNAGNITVANSAALNFETTPTFSLTVTVTDNGTPILSGSATITVNLSDVNDAPAIANQTFGIPENSANGTTVGTVVASDEDAGQTITYAITAGNIGTAFAIDLNTGVITVNNSAALDFETQPSFALLVTVTDNAPTPASSTAVVTINLSDVNEAPVVNPATFTIPESSANGTAVGTVTFTDPDAGQTHTFAITGGNTGGAFAIDNSGNITVANSAALDFETTPSFSLTVTVTDNGSPVLSGGATITVNLTNVNEAPVNSVPVAQSTFEDVPLVFSSGNGNLISISDPDAGASPVQVTLTATSGTLSLSGTTGLSFTVGTGSGDATMTFTGAISDINAALAGMQFVPTLDYNGAASVAITTNDQGNTGSGGALSDTDTVDITVNAVNDLPVAVDDSYTVDGGATLTEPAPGVLGNDSDVDTPPASLTAVLVSGPTHATSFTLNPDGSFTYVNDGLGANSDSFTYTANDPFGPSNTATVTITVQNNDPPNVNPATFTIAENSANGTAVGTVTFTDAESATETYTFAITAGNTGGAFAISNAGAITVANSTALDFETNPSFSLTVQVTDDGTPVQSGTATITVNLTNLNEAPVVNAATFSLAENSANGTVVGTATFTDSDTGQTHTFSITAGNTGGAFAIDPSTGQITVANSGAVDFETTPTFSLTVRVDDNGAPALFGTNTITVNLTDVNEAPAPSGSFSIAENSANGTVVGTVNANDPDAGQTHTFIITAGNTGGAFAIDVNTGQITVASSTAVDFEVNPTFSLTVQATDNGTPILSGSGTVTITVTDVNEAPVLNDQARSINENSANGTNVGAPLTFTDPDTGQTFTFSITVGNTGGAFAISNTGQITVANSAAVNFEVNPTFTLTVQITDNGTPNLSDTATVTITVNDLNEAPVAVDETYATVIGNTTQRFGDGGGTMTSNVFHTSPADTNPLANDTDPDTNPAFNTLAIVPVDNAATNQGGKISIDADGTFTYTPPPGFTGSDFYDYTLTDGTNTDIGRMNFTVSNLVWYVKNDDGGAPFLGTSSDPFNTLAAAGTATPTVPGTANTIFVFKGDGTSTGMNAGITLDVNQNLIGAAASLIIGGDTLVVGNAANRPVIGNAAGDGVNVVANATTTNAIKGLSISGAGGAGNGIDITTTAGTVDITLDDLVVTGSTQEGIDINVGGGTVTLNLSNLTVVAGTTGIDINRTLGTATVATFNNITIGGATGGSGIVVNNVAFGSLSAGTFAIGSSGDHVGSAGMILSTVTGGLTFTDLDIFADGPLGALVVDGNPTFQITVPSGLATLIATAGPAANLTDANVDLQSVTLTSNNSPANGVNLNNVIGTFSTTSNPNTFITNAGAADFNISGGNANVTYNGTITDDVGQLVSVANATGGTKIFAGAITDNDNNTGNGVSLTNNTGATIRFNGGLVLSTGANPAFAATGGGTVEVCDENPCNAGATGALINKITTTTGTALNVANTTIGANKLEFRSISSNGAATGITLNATGSLGGLSVKGDGTLNSGGTIQNASTGISATDTQDLSLTRMLLTTITNNAINANNLRGTCTIDTTTITAFGNTATGNGISLVNNNANLTKLTVTGSTFSAAPNGNDGIFMEAQGTSNMVLSVEGGSHFTGLFGDGVQADTITGASGTVNVTVKNSTFDNAAPLGNNGIALIPFGGPVNFTALVDSNTFDTIMRPVSNLGAISMTNGKLTSPTGPTASFTIQNNTFNNIVGSRGITITADTFSGPTTVVIDNNDIDRLNSNHSAINVNFLDNVTNGNVKITNNRIGQAAALWTTGPTLNNAVLVLTQVSASMRALVQGNTITANTSNIFEVLRFRSIGNSSVNATVTGNTISDTDTTHVEFDMTTANTATACLNISGNTVPAAGVGVIKLSESAGTINVVQASAAAVAAANNGATVTVTGTPTFGVAPCSTPP